MNPVYDDIDSETIECETATVSDTATITNLIVTGIYTGLDTGDSSGNFVDITSTGTANLNDVDISGNLIVDGTSTLSSLDVSGNAVVNGDTTMYGNVQIGRGETAVGNVVLANAFVYMAYNGNGAAPEADAGGVPQMYGCITGNYQVGQDKLKSTSGTLPMATIAPMEQRLVFISWEMIIHLLIFRIMGS